MYTWMTLSEIYVLPFFMYLCGVLTFIGKRKHLMNTLLSLEYIAVTLFFLLTFSTMSMGSDIYMCLFYLALAVCEGSLGLGLLVSMARSHGGDLMKALVILN